MRRHVHLGAILFAGLIANGADLFRVSGTVIDGLSGSPVSRVRVFMTLPERRSSETFVVTGDNGAFSFDLPAGKYQLTGERKGQARQHYGQSFPNATFGTAVVTGEGHRTTGLQFRWYAPIGISGKIVDEAGEPVERAMVQLLHTDFLGRKRTHTIARTYTDDRGEYRFGGIPASTFYIAVTASPWYTNDRIARTALAPEKPRVAFRPMFYPNTSDARAAAPLVLKPGEETVANFSLFPVEAAKVSVHVDGDSVGSKQISLLIDGLAGTEGVQIVETFNGADHVVSAVPPGQYRVRVVSTVGDRTLWASQPIDVGSSDVDVRMTLKDTPLVTGVVQLVNPAAQPSGTLMVALTEEVRGTMTRAAGSDGSFRFVNVPPGVYRPSVRGTDGYFISRLSMNGTEVKDGLIEVKEGAAAQLEIVASDAVGRMRGFVYRSETPVPGATVILAPKIDSPDAGDYRYFQTDSDGSFDFEHVRAGQYFIFAVEGVELEFANPVVLRPYLPAAKTVQIARKGVYSERIDLPPLPAAQY